MKMLIKNGRVIDPAQNIDGTMDVLLEDGKIMAVAAGLSGGADKADRVLDARGLVVSPGFIDMHVHLREPGFEGKETIKTGTRAAVLGGFTTVACMPNTNPVIDNQSVVEFILSRAERDGVARVHPIGAITKRLEGAELSEIGDLKKAGAVAVSDDGRPVMSAEIMRRAMQYARMFDLPVIDHCEDLSLVSGGVMNEGAVATRLGLPGIPAVAEEIMVRRDIALAAATGAHFHAAHVSTRGAVAAVREAKRSGVAVTAEACPHHFSMDQERVGNYDTLCKVNPPLREKEDVDAVRQGLADGTLDCIATDHAPHSMLDKDVEFQAAAFGMVGLETALGLGVVFLVETGVLPLSQLVRLLTLNPARVLRLDQGTLRPGAPADLTLFDPAAEWTVDRDRFASRSRNTPFHGWTLRGRVVHTIVNGRLVVEQGKLTL